MAYVYNKLASQMGADEGKQNIFGLMPGQQEGGGSGGGQALKLTGEGGGEAGAGAPTVKDTGEGDAKNTANLQSGAQQAQIAELNKPAQTDQQAEQVYGNINQTIQQRESQLQEEANKYKEKAEGATVGDFYGDRDTVKQKLGSYIDGKPSDFSALRSFISGEATPQVESYQSNISTGDIRIPQSQAQLAETLQRQSARPTYTAGQARLDAALLGGSQQFQSEQARLRDQKERLEGQRIRAAQEAERQQQQAAERYTSQQGVVRDILGELADEMIAAQGAERQALEQYNPQLEDARRAYEQAAQKYTGSTDFDFGTYSDTVNPLDFYQRSLTEYADDPMAYFDDAERSRYNQLADLLGLGGAVEMGPTYNEGFDVYGYQQAIAADKARRDREREYYSGTAEQPGEVDPATMSNVPGEDIIAGQAALPEATVDPNSDIYNYQGPRPTMRNSNINDAPSGVYATTYDMDRGSSGGGGNLDEYFKRLFQDSISRGY